MRVRLNGEARELDPGMTAGDLVASLDLGDRPFAVEINKRIVPKSELPERPIEDADEIEVVTIVGGG